MLHFGKIPKNFGQNWSEIQQKSDKICRFCKHQQNVQQVLTKKLRLKNDSKTVQRSTFCRSRRELSNAYFLAKFGFDTAENEPCQVSWCFLSGNHFRLLSDNKQRGLYVEPSIQSLRRFFVRHH
jgi:hypothetical protein